MPRKEFVAFTRLDASDVNTYLMDQSVMTFATSAARGSAIAAPVEGMLAYLQDSNTIQAYNASAWVTVANAGTAAYNLVQTLYYTSSGTFTKADYTWLRAIKVKCQGAGGGGSGSPTSGTGCNPAGGGGGYAESFITDISGLASSVTVTRGAGGAAGAAGADGAAGGNSSFGTVVIGNGSSATDLSNVRGGLGGAGTGDLIVRGGGGQGFLPGGQSSSQGGGAFLGASNAAQYSNITRTGDNGVLYGGGANGGMRAATNASGGTGANGIVIVELYA
jgi:hypothetical protein